MKFSVINRRGSECTLIFLDRSYEVASNMLPEIFDKFLLSIELTHDQLWETIDYVISKETGATTYYEYYVAFVYKNYNKRLGKGFISKIKSGEIPLLTGLDCKKELSGVNLITPDEVKKKGSYFIDTGEDDSFVDYFHFGIVHLMDKRLEKKDFIYWYALFYILKKYGYKDKIPGI